MTATAYRPSSFRAAYNAAELQTVSQRDLLVKMFEGIERFLVMARNAMAERRPEAAHVNCQKAKAIIVELLATLDFNKGGEIAVQLKQLYLFMLAGIVEGNLRKDPQAIDALLPIVTTLREGWQRVPSEYSEVSTLSENQGHALNLRG